MIKKEFYVTLTGRLYLIDEYTSAGWRLDEDYVVKGVGNIGGSYLIFHSSDEPIPHTRVDDSLQIKSDNFIETLKTKTPNEATEWVENNITDPESVKTLLKTIMKILVYMLRRM